MKKKKQIRANFRTVCLYRDNYKCKLCGYGNTNVNETELDVHHITDRTEMPNGGYVLENGISLCADCHRLAEEYHINDGLEWVEGIHPNDLYALIGSSKEDA